MSTVNSWNGFSHVRINQGYIETRAGTMDICEQRIYLEHCSSIDAASPSEHIQKEITDMVECFFECIVSYNDSLKAVLCYLGLFTLVRRTTAFEKAKSQVNPFHTYIF